MDTNQYIQLALALIVVLGLMWLLSLVLKKINNAQSGMSGKSNRLKIVEQRMIDTKTKVAIVRCDNKDHLVLLGQNGQTLIKGDMPIPPEKSKKDIPLESF